MKSLSNFKRRIFFLSASLIGFIVSRVKGFTDAIHRSSVADLKISFSQLGEDLIILDLLEANKKRPQNGIYLDVGCYDPFKYSNTYLLNLRGWTGINIDGSVSSIAKFNQHRPNDINIVGFLSAREQDLYYLEYSNSPTNKLANAQDERNLFNDSPVNSTLIRTRTLDSFLDDIKLEKEIHFLNIDCEGEDLGVLKGLNIDRYCPFTICIEAHTAQSRNEIQEYLRPYEYDLYAHVGPTNIFLRTGRR